MLDLVLENAAVVVNAGQDAGARGAGGFAKFAAGVLLEEVVDRLHGLGVVIGHGLDPFLAPADGRAERDAPDFDLSFVLDLLQLGKQIVAELRQLDVVGHVEIDDVGAEPLQRFLQGEAQEFWGEILLCVRVAAGLAGIGVEVVAELCRRSRLCRAGRF